MHHLMLTIHQHSHYNCHISYVFLSLDFSLCMVLYQMFLSLHVSVQCYIRCFCQCTLSLCMVLYQMFLSLHFKSLYSVMSDVFVIAL